MKTLVVAIFSLLVAVGQAEAGNTPCSGKKGGISHCEGGRFICNDGSVSQSKKVCSAPNTPDTSKKPKKTKP